MQWRCGEDAEVEQSAQSAVEVGSLRTVIATGKATSSSASVPDYCLGELFLVPSRVGLRHFVSTRKEYPLGDAGHFPIRLETILGHLNRDISTSVSSPPGPDITTTFTSLSPNLISSPLASASTLHVLCPAKRLNFGPSSAGSGSAHAADFELTAYRRHDSFKGWLSLRIGTDGRVRGRAMGSSDEVVGKFRRMKCEFEPGGEVVCVVGMSLMLMLLASAEGMRDGRRARLHEPVQFT